MMLYCNVFSYFVDYGFGLVAVSTFHESPFFLVLHFHLHSSSRSLQVPSIDRGFNRNGLPFLLWKLQLQILLTLGWDTQGLLCFPLFYSDIWGCGKMCPGADICFIFHFRACWMPH